MNKKLLVDRVGLQHTIYSQQLKMNVLFHKLKNITTLVTVSRSCRLTAHDLLTSTQNVVLFSGELFNDCFQRVE